jgi:hypothetical protein
MSPNLDLDEVNYRVLASCFDTEDNLRLHSYPNSRVSNLSMVLSGSLEACEEKMHERLCFFTDIQFGIASPCLNLCRSRG